MENAAPSDHGSPSSQPEPTGTPSPMAGARMLRMVMPLVGSGVYAGRATVRHALGEAAAWAAVALVLVVLLTPAVVLLIAGLWAIVTCIMSAVTIYQLIASSRLGDTLAPFQTLDLAGRVVGASASYFALLSSLLVLEAGLLGRRWRRLFLFPGIVLTIPSILVFYFAQRLLLDALGAIHLLSPLARTALMLYLALDAIVLGACLVDFRPRRRRARARRWRRRATGSVSEIRWQPESGLAAAPSMPLVHFGPAPLPLAPALDAPGAVDAAGAAPITPDPPEGAPADDPPGPTRDQAS